MRLLDDFAFDRFFGQEADAPMGITFRWFGAGPVDGFDQARDRRLKREGQGIDRKLDARPSYWSRSAGIRFA